jgi:phosphate transport system substrate-binding protein
MKVRLQLLVLPTMIAALLSDPIHAQVPIDPALPEYKVVQGVSGQLKCVGSDTMKHEMELLIEGFTRFYPTVRPEVAGKGSASAPPALLAGDAQFAPMSRGMTAREVDDFKKKYGYPPLALPTSIDMLEVYVHKDNPIKGMTLQQVDAVFSRTRKGGYAKSIHTWGDLGLEGEWADKPIVLYGRNKISGTHKFFLEHALFNGAFRDEVHEQLDSDSVVEHVAREKYAIGYSGMGYQKAAVRALTLALDIKSEYVAPEPANAYSGDYPLTRMLFLYVNHQPGTALDPLRREFIRYLYSKQGQSDVVRSGYLPLGKVITTRALNSVEHELWSPASHTPAPTGIATQALKPVEPTGAAPVAQPPAPIVEQATVAAATSDHLSQPKSGERAVWESYPARVRSGIRLQDRRRRWLVFPR